MLSGYLGSNHKKFSPKVDRLSVVAELIDTQLGTGKRIWRVIPLLLKRRIKFFASLCRWNYGVETASQLCAYSEEFI